MISPGAESPPPPPSSAHRRREARAIRVGLLTSGLLHLVLILLYRALTGVPGVQFAQGPSAPGAPTLTGTEIVELLEREEPIPLPEPPVPPSSSAPPTAPAATSVPATTPSPEPGPDLLEIEVVDGELTLAERLQPRLGDPRIWAPIPADFTQLTEFERAEILLRGMLESYNDSVAIAAALSERATDWTFTDDSGRRWGLGAGRLYLGDFSIPLPALEFAPGLLEDVLDRRAVQAELARAAAAAQLRDTWMDRARIIREQMEVDRRSTPPRAADGGGGE